MRVADPGRILTDFHAAAGGPPLGRGAALADYPGRPTSRPGLDERARRLLHPDRSRVEDDLDAVCSPCWCPPCTGVRHCVHATSRSTKFVLRQGYTMASAR